MQKRSATQPPQDSKERIAAAARRLFAELGFDGTTTKAIATEAGVPSGLVFYYFDNKEALLEYVFSGDNVFVTVRDALEETKDASPLTGIAPVSWRAYEWLANNREFTALFFKELTSHRPIAARLREIRKAGIALIKQRFDQYLERGQIAEDTDTQVVAQMLVSTVFNAALVDKPENPKVFIDRVVATLLRGIAPPSLHKR